MKLSHVALALAAILVTPSAFAASILTTESSGKSLDNVAVSKGGKMTIEGRTTNLITMGAGIRTALLGIHAYEAEVLVNDNKAYVCDQAKALDSLKNLSGVAIRINVLFSFGKDKLVEALNAGFEANDVDADNKDIQKFLAAVKAGPDAPKGDVIVFAGEKLADGSEAVTYENQGRAVTVKGASGLVRSIFGLWLGKTDDSGLKTLNKNLTTCQM